MSDAERNFEERRKVLLARVPHLKAAEEQFAAATRQYLWEMVRITENPEWELEPDYALLAVARVVLRHVCYRDKQLAEGEIADASVIETMGRLAEELATEIGE
jgi:hypothetical protein